VNYIKKNWGYELVIANTELYFGLIKIITESEKTPLIYHKKRDISVFVLQGSVIIELEGKKKTLNGGESIHICPKIIYRLFSVKSDATIIEIGSKNEDDTVLIEE
jgi:quercetin dioxygenase-like cupin family protein